MQTDGNLFLSEEQGMIRDMARDFAARELAPHAAEWDRNGGFPDDMYRRMGALGLMGMLVPEEWGGAGVDYGTYALVVEELAAGDASVSTMMSVHTSVVCLPILNFGAISTSDQLARLKSGAISAEEFDFSALRWDFGEPGREAL